MTVTFGHTRVGAVELAPGDPAYPDLGRALGYWEGRRAGRIAPRRAEIDPLDLVEVLPRIMLADVLRDPLDFRYRLSGTGICTVHGEDHTNRSPRDLKPAEFGEMIHAHYREAVARRIPLQHHIQLDSRERMLSYVRLLLPLSENGTDVTMLMAVDSKEQNTQALRDYFARLVAR